MALRSRRLTGDQTAINDFIDRFDAFLFDCDGVLWSGDHLFDGTVKAIELLKRKVILASTECAHKGKQIVFVTNNSTKSRFDYQTKMESMGIPAAIKKDEVFGSSYSAAIYISRILALPKEKRTVFVLGEAGIETELDSESIPHTGGTDPSLQREITPRDFQDMASGAALDKSVGVVLCGLDFHLNYLKLAYAYHYITQNNAIFLATNSDTTLPNSHALFPGAGACAAPLVAMLGGKEPLSLGKPSQAMMDAVEGKFKFKRSRACMVGDRLDTDIKFGIDGNLGGTLCVMTGVTSSAKDWESAGAPVPLAWVDELGDLAASR